MRHAIILMLVTANALAAIEIKTNTATKIVVGPFLDATDGLTPKTTLTVGDIDAELVYQSGGSVIVTELTLTASGGDNDMVLATGSENGYWALELTAAQTNFVGHAKIGFYDPNDVFVPVWNELSVISANYWDTKYGTDKFDVNVSEWSGTSVATPDTAGYPKVTIKSGTGAGELSITSGRAAADAILIEGTDATDMIGQAVWNDTSIRTLTAIDEDNTTLDINAAVGVALSDIGLDHLLSAAVTGTDVADNSLFAKLVSASTTADWDDYDNTTDSLQAIRDRGDSAWAAAGTIADVWTYATRELTALDEDNTAIDLDGSTIGTATSVTNAVSANITQVGGSAIGTPNVAGYLPVDSVYVVGDTPASESTVAQANWEYAGGRTITGGTVTTNNDKTGYGLADGAITSAKYDGTTASALSPTRAGYLDKLNVSGTLAHSDAAATYKATGFASATDWTATRAGYLDKLNVSGTLAHSDAAATYKATGFASATDWTSTRAGYLDTLHTWVTPPPGADYPSVNVAEWADTDVATPDTAGYPVVTVKDGTGTGEIDTDSGKIAIADGGIRAASYVAGAIDPNTLADGAITAAKIATGAIDADALATDAQTELITALLDTTITGAISLEDALQGVLALWLGTSEAVDDDTYKFYDPGTTTLRLTVDYGDNDTRTTITLVED